MSTKFDTQTPHHLRSPHGEPIPGREPDGAFASERGARRLVRSIIPFRDTERDQALRGALEDDLIELFGGFTSYPSRGGWRDNGVTMVEPGIVYEVTGPASADFSERARLQFCHIGAYLGEKWIHFEIHHIHVHHTQVADADARAPEPSAIVAPLPDAKADALAEWHQFLDDAAVVAPLVKEHRNI